MVCALFARHNGIAFPIRTGIFSLRDAGLLSIIAMESLLGVRRGGAGLLQRLLLQGRSALIHFSLELSERVSSIGCREAHPAGSRSIERISPETSLQMAEC